MWSRLTGSDVYTPWYILTELQAELVIMRGASDYNLPSSLLASLTLCTPINRDPIQPVHQPQPRVSLITSVQPPERSGTLRIKRWSLIGIRQTEQDAITL